MRVIFFLLFLVSTIVVGYAQQKNYPTISYDRWMIDGGILHQVALNDLSSDPVTDYLFSYESATYLELFSGTYFFNQEWGINVDIQLGSFGERSEDRNERFEKALEASYGENYFINPIEIWDYPKANPTNVVGGMSYGFVYRQDKNKFRFLSSLDIGFRSFEVKEASYLLKEKGSNNILSLSYSNDGVGGFLSFISPRIKCLYQLKNDFYLKLDVNYSLSFSNFYIVEEIEDTANDKVSTRTIDYSKTLHTIGFGLGIAFFL